VFKAVIFDLFGTVLEPWDMERHRATLSRMAKALNVGSDDFGAAWGHYAAPGMNGAFGSIEEQITRVCDALSAHVRPEQVSLAESVLLDDARDYLLPRGDALATMMRVKGLGLKGGVISNCGLEVPRLWQELRFSHYVDAPVFSCVSGLKKPWAQVYEQALDLLGVSPEQALFVDDDPAFVEGARAVGVVAVRITNDPSTQTSDQCVARLSDILPMLS
jgi:putative hydrolase of the HAD superfamily